MFKFDDWRYERERRILVALREDNKEGDNYFIGYQHGLELKQVIVGMKSTITRAELEAALGELRPNVDLCRARRSMTTFGVVRDERAGAFT